MGFRDKITDYYTKSYIKKYGDRLTQAQGNVLSEKIFMDFLRTYSCCFC